MIAADCMCGLGCPHIIITAIALFTAVVAALLHLRRDE